MPVASPAARRFPTAPPPRRTSAKIRTLLFVLSLSTALPAAAQLTTLAERTVTPNGRTVQEIRLGADPSGPTMLRTMVITNGPTAGTTTLLTSVAEANALLAGTGAAPTFTTVLASATAFSLGGGCRRGNQLDFPFIDANRPKFFRIVGGSGTVVPLPILDTDFYDSADCAVANDGSATYFIYSNRSLSRLSVFRDTGGANDLLGPLISLSSVKTPFVGGLRPALAPLPASFAVPGTPAGNQLFAFSYMRTDGTTHWLQYDITGFDVDFDCLLGAQSPPPSGFTIPRGNAVIGHTGVGDFNGDGIAEILRVNKGVSPACAGAPTSTPFGSVAGTAFNWVEFGTTTMRNGAFAIVGNQSAIGPPTTVFPGPFGTAGGSHAAITVRPVESVVDAELAVAMSVLNHAFGYKLARSSFVPTPPPPPSDEIYGTSMEELAAIEGFIWSGGPL
jgi:hypothetical protein